MSTFGATVLVLCVALCGCVFAQNTNEEEAIEFLRQYDEAYGPLANDYIIKSWNYETNITDENGQLVVEASLLLKKFSAEAFANASTFNSTNFSFDTKRQLDSVGSKSFPDENNTQNLTQILQELSSIYSRGEVCLQPDNCLTLEPGLTEIMGNSRNESLLRYVWEQWRTNVGRPMKPLYEQYVELKNALARIRGYTDYGAEMRDRYELESFEEDMLALYEQLRPLYMELHAYVRRKLYNQYGPDVIDLTGPIPSHILGDMWGRFWTNIYRICEPFENGASIDPTDEMIEQGYTTRRMFDMGDGFFRSMGLIGVPDSFFELSMLERPEDGRDVSCHATAWDFLDGKDFRIKMCTEINFDYFLTIHHEMGHIQYFMQYAHQPIVYRDGAHDGFHEAIGEVMSMSVATPSHLYSVGLLENLEDNYETDINFLLLQSFGSVSTLPFHLVNDLWRWKAFRGDYEAGRWNEEFWKLKNEYVGVRPPVPRSSEDLDPPALFHISGDYDMMRYFTRTILQYQFQEKLCQAAGHQGPVYKCDFANSTEAGQILSTMLQLGRSLPWPDALEALTGSRNMDVRPLVNYFQPLYEFLQRTNAANGDVPGWTQDTIRKSLKYEPVAPEQELLQRNSDGL